MATDYDALFNYTAKQQGITPAQAKQNFLAKYGQTETPAQAIAPVQETIPQQQTITQDTGALANVGDEPPEEKDFTYGVGEGTFTYFNDPETGKSYQYDNNKGKSGDVGWVGGLPPEDGKGLQITSILKKDDGEWKKTDVSDKGLTYGGLVDPEVEAARLAETRKDDPSDNDIFYTDPNGKTYVDVSGTGQSIPVGATSITRDPTQLGRYDAEGNFEKYDSSGYTQPVLTKTFQGYEPDTGMYSDVGGITPEQYAKLSPDEKLKLAQSDVPTASTNFKDLLKPGSGQFDVGSYFGMDKGALTFSNPPSNQFDLNKFLNQTESFGTQNYLRSQSTDILNDIIKKGNFFNALAGKNFEMADGTMYYDKIYQPGYGTSEDGTFSGTPIQGFDMGQLEGFFNDLASKRDKTTGDVIYSNTPYSIDPFDITGNDDSLQNRNFYGSRPIETQMVQAYRGGLGPYADVQYLTRYGYNPTVGNEMLQYDEASGVYFDPVTGQEINSESLEGFALSDPETVDTGLTEQYLQGRETINPLTGEKLYYDPEGNPMSEDQYLNLTTPLQTGVI
tara:strand:- start:428 stop:2110 length:1683 start_codon:yes stop_codon:yes gene_type:complete